MNRLILIGNGFDLAHNLKTSYKDFIEYLWKGIFIELRQKMYKTNGRIMNSPYPDACFEFIDNNDLIKLEYQGNEYRIGNNILYLKIFTKHKQSVEFTLELDKDDSNNILLNNLKELISIYNENFYLYQNPSNGYRSDNYINKFFRIISQNYINKNWSDIEADYYKELLKVKDNQIDINELNKQFKQIKELLREYLKSLPQVALIEKIKRQIYSPILYRDINLKHRKIYFDEIYNKLEQLINSPELQDKIKNCYLDFDDRCFFSDCLDINSSIKIDYKALKQRNEEDLKSYIRIHYDKFNQSQQKASDFYLKSEELPKFLFAPDSYLFLNFNYTDNERSYRIRGYDPIFKEKTAPLINHIHGSLDDPNNHMIFGYGDEEAYEYKELEKLDYKGLLDNVKSINYLEASNYRDMERFIESDKFQIFIMGMSCGMADRTMLRKLFQHKNCVSVKPFFYQWKDDEGNIAGDNYTEIVQNISRCFSDKDLLRSVVVNKPNCEPLPQWND